MRSTTRKGSSVPEAAGCATADMGVVVKSSGCSNGGAPPGGCSSGSGGAAAIKRSPSIAARKGADIPEVAIDFEVRRGV
jgi:hypothetical protein